MGVGVYVRRGTVRALGWLGFRCWYLYVPIYEHTFYSPFVRHPAKKVERKWCPNYKFPWAHAWAHGDRPTRTYSPRHKVELSLNMFAKSHVFEYVFVCWCVCVCSFLCTCCLNQITISNTKTTTRYARISHCAHLLRSPNQQTSEHQSTATVLHCSLQHNRSLFNSIMEK